MNRREMLGVGFIPFVTSLPDEMCLSKHKELAKKKRQLCKLIKEIYDIEVETKEIDNVRLWKLGYIGPTIQTCVFPTKQAIDRLRELINSIPNDTKFNIIWGPELDCKLI